MRPDQLRGQQNALALAHRLNKDLKEENATLAKEVAELRKATKDEQIPDL